MSRSFPQLAIVGPIEVVYNRTTQGCPEAFAWDLETPDSVPIAWHSAKTNITRLLVGSTHAGTHVTLGSSLHNLTNLKHDCAAPSVWPPVNYSAVQTYDPRTYNNFQWLQSVRAYANGDAFCVTHNEMHGELSGMVSNATRLAPPNQTLCTARDAVRGVKKCIYWSSVLGASADGGATFRRVDESKPLFSLPRPYVKDAKLAGYGALGGIQWDPATQAHYGHVFRTYENGTGSGPLLPPGSPQDYVHGVCTWRTNNLSDATAFRGWNGSAWGTRWGFTPYDGPYPADAATIARRSCASIDTGGLGSSHPQPRRLVLSDQQAPNKPWPSHVMIGLPAGAINDHHSISYSFSAWEDGAAAPFTQWTSAQTIDNIDQWLDPQIYGRLDPTSNFLHYPTLIDSDSPFALLDDVKARAARRTRDQSNTQTKTEDADGAAATARARRNVAEDEADALSYNLVGNGSSLYLYFNVRVVDSQPSQEVVVRAPVQWFADPAASTPVPPFPPTPLPRFLAPNCSRVLIQGAGLAEVNGLYDIYVPKIPSDDIVAKYNMGANHSIYCITGAEPAAEGKKECSWHIAHSGVTVFYFFEESEVHIPASGKVGVPVEGWVSRTYYSGITASCDDQSVVNSV